jgi:phosphatidylglycerol:prolipoprotein diacylglycerol transferase
LYSVLRFIVEFFRGDAARGVYFGGAISTSQLVSIVMFFVSLFMLFQLGRKQQGRAAVEDEKKGRNK